MDPRERIKELAEQANSVEIDSRVPPKRLFVEKIRKHPDYESVPVDMLHSNKSTLKMVFGKAEKIKDELKERYIKQYYQWQEEQKLLKKQQEKEEARRRRNEERLREENAAKLRFEEEKRRLLDDSHTLAKVEEPPASPMRSPESGTDEFTPSIEAQLDELHISDKNVNPSIPSRSLKPDLNKRPTSSPRPTVDRSTKPTSLLSHSKAGLREVIVPGKVVVKFLDLAEPNTARNLETCGILAGTMSNSQFIITHLLIPKQSGTSDSCTTTNEEDLFTYQDKYNLITLGWIHLMMPEALAIVCAPKHSQTGYFCLSPNYGLEFIANCQETGFHPHPSHPPLFQEAEHVRVDESVDVTVADFR